MATAVISAARPEAGSSLDQPMWPAPVRWWAGLGAAFVVLQIGIYGAWLLRGEMAPTSTGADEVPGATRVAAITLQVVLVTGAVLTIAWVVRKCIRERRLVLDAVLLLAWASLFWQDPLCNYLRPTFFYNSELVNLGSWVNGVPGWSSPNGNHLPEPLLLIGCFYLAFGMLMTIVTCNIMRLAKQRWPHFGAIKLIGVAFAAMFACDLIAELVFVRTEMYAYPAVIRPLTLFGGERYQFPIYEAFFVAPVLCFTGALRYFKDDKGRLAVERGVEQVTTDPRRQTRLRVLAVVGFVNIVSFLTYAIPMNLIALHTDRFPEGYPTYLTNELCGAGTPYACPGPDIPVPLRGSQAVSPSGDG